MSNKKEENLEEVKKVEEVKETKTTETKAKTKNIFIIYNKYILLNYILLLLCSYTH